MPTRTQINIGSAPGCELVLHGNGVAPRHAVLLWRDGLWIQDLGQGRTVVDGRPLSPNESVQLPGFHSAVTVGDARVPLTSPEISKLFLDRSSLAVQPPGVIVVGRDPARAHAIVAHPTVSGAHLRVDINARTVTDLGSKSGTFDRNSQRLAANQPVSMDIAGGYSLGAVWVPTSVLMECAGASPGAIMADPMGAGFATSQGAAPNAPMPIHMPSQVPPMPSMQGGHPSMQGGHPSMQGGLGSLQGGMPSSPGASAAAAPQRTMFGTFDLAGGGKSIAIIGRLPTCDIALPYPQVSARHTSVMKSPDGNILVGDLGSTNGTYVNGQRLVPGQPMAVPPKTKIFVGPYPMIVDLQGNAITAYIEQDNAQWTGNLVEVEALDLHLEVPDRNHPGTMKTLLNHVTFKALPGDLIALMGPSGAGKTTLLTVLNGYLRPTSGEVRVNGENLYAIYDALRGSLGYVPQDDLLHPELTVKEAITYSARFRLPPDYSAEEIERRVLETMKDLGLDALADTVIGSPIKKVLSGGQRKRVNIALELVTDPALMFLDEPTSGLAADDTVALIDLLAKLAKEKGKTIVVTIHQPAKEEFEKFNLTFIMGFGGEPIYFGPTGTDSYDFFARYRGKPIDNPRDMFDQLKHREDDLVKGGQVREKKDARLPAAQGWRAEFYRPDNTVYRKMYSGKREPGKPGTNRRPTKVSVPLVRQFILLLSRYAKIKQRDTAGMMIMMLQAPIIGGLLAAVFYKPPGMPNLWCQSQVQGAEAAVAQRTQQLCQLGMDRFKNVEDYKGALFFLTVGSLWFGTSNAAREIVSEIAIYRRERMVNLSIFNYVMSKFALLTLLCIVQCVVLLSVVYGILGIGDPLGVGNGEWSSFAPMLGTMVLTSMSSVALGLLLSAVVTSSEAAMGLTPIALIPQVVLGGMLVPMTNKSWLKYVMALMPSRWSFEGIIGAERYALENTWRIPTCVPAGSDNGVVEWGGRPFFNCAVREIASTTSGVGGWGFASYDNPLVANGVLAFMTVFFLAGVMIFLRRRDSV
jgi:ABC-type multidrug transport system ATPase subunit/pSer/pThr/pTyr-binding forkhead associated (FHA) protein